MIILSEFWYFQKKFFLYSSLCELRVGYILLVKDQQTGRSHHSKPILCATLKVCLLFFKFDSVLYIKTVSNFKWLDFSMQFNNFKQKERLYNTTQKNRNLYYLGFVHLIASFFFSGLTSYHFSKYVFICWFDSQICRILEQGTCSFPLCYSNFYTSSFTTTILATCNLQLF